MQSLLREGTLQFYRLITASRNPSSHCSDCWVLMDVTISPPAHKLTTFIHNPTAARWWEWLSTTTDLGFIWIQFWKSLRACCHCTWGRRNGTHRPHEHGVSKGMSQKYQNWDVTLKLAFSYSFLLITVCNLWKSHLKFSQVIKHIFLSIVVRTFTKYLPRITNIHCNKNWAHLGNQNLSTFTIGNQFVQFMYFCLCNPYSLWPKNRFRKRLYMNMQWKTSTSEVNLYSRGYRYVYKLFSSLALLLNNSTQFFSWQFKIMQSITMLQTKQQKQALILNKKKRKWHFLKVPVVLSQ